MILRKAFLACLGSFLVASSSFAGGLARQAPPRESEPDPATVERVGSGYRYPQDGWIVLHIEGEPYARGYQHGKLLASEISDYIQALSAKRSSKAPAEAWSAARLAVNALFLRRYDPEYLEEMKGIADGAAASGIKVDGRVIDLLDVAVINSEIELAFLDAALEATATGVEGKVFEEPIKTDPAVPGPPHCSAFAAVGPATADGKIVFGHITMFSLAMVPHFNIWLDVKASKGHRVFMQTYPGGIQSGMDYYFNDNGMIVCETTIRQTKFDVEGKPLATRIRKALQYANSIDDAASLLETANNGLYTNEWLLADTKTNEIAMFDLGTHKSKLWRSSKKEWFGGTEGFYWGCNNPKELEVRLETVASLADRPANVVFHPSERDRKWIELYQANRGKIDEGFGFEAFTTPPLAAYSSCDAKFTTTALAGQLKTYALFGPPLGRTWEPTIEQRQALPSIRPLVGNDWTLLTATPPVVSTGGTIAAVDLASSVKNADRSPSLSARQSALSRLPAWRGTLLPNSDADVWLAAAFADYERQFAREKAMGSTAKDSSEDLALALLRFGPWSRYKTSTLRWGKEVPLSQIQSAFASNEWYETASTKGVLLLQALRGELGDPAFIKLMNTFGIEHAGKPAKTSDFKVAAETMHGKPLDHFFEQWLTKTGIPAGGFEGYWSVDSFQAEPENAVIVAGTLRESSAQREAAVKLQQAIRRRWMNITVPIVEDSSVSDAMLKSKHLLVVGRPETNALATRIAKELPIHFGKRSFEVNSKTYANAGTAVVVASANPFAPRYSVVVFAGMSAEATWRCVDYGVDNRASEASQGVVLVAKSQPRPFVVQPQPTASSNRVNAAR